MDTLPTQAKLSRSDLVVLLRRHFGAQSELPVSDSGHFLDLPRGISFSLGKICLRDGTVAFSARASVAGSRDRLHVLYRVYKGSVHLVVVESTLSTKRLQREIGATVKFVKGKGPRPSCSLLSVLAALPLMGLSPRSAE